MVIVYWISEEYYLSFFKYQFSFEYHVMTHPHDVVPNVTRDKNGTISHKVML